MHLFNPTPQRSRRADKGSVLIAALLIIAVLATISGTILFRAVPAFRSTYHASAWQEAKLAADAGVDLAMAAIQSSVPFTNDYTWPGWTLPNGSPVPAGYDGVRVLVPSASLLTNTGDGSTKPTILKVEVDVITRDANESKNPWYRIRSTGAADINSTVMGMDKRDQSLRRINLSNRRVTRTVEVETRPLYLWEYALKTQGSMTLGGGSDWRIDSYDHRYSTLTPEHRGSINGMYDKSMSGDFGNIASNMQRPASSPYGVLIDAAGAMVRGEVQTHGGDNPDTVEHENVEESQNIDQTKITSDFDETLLPPENPTAPALTPAAAALVRRVTVPWIGPDVTNPSGALPSSFGVLGGKSVTNPVRIKLQPNGNQTQGGFTVAPSPDGQPRFVEVYVNANLSLGGSNIQVPPNVYVKLFVNGNLDFKNQDLNYSDTSSRVPGNLQIYGVSTGAAPRVDSSGNGHIVGVFYGPQYAGNLDGNTEIVGGFVLKSYYISGGGGSGGDSVGAGFHYDEALGVVGPIQAFKAVSYFEDARKDLD